MNSKEYVLQHDYGYGKNVNPNNINKLYLRNIEDLKVYVKDIVYKNVISLNEVNISDINKTIVIEKVDVI